jgi:predicted secreted protein
VGEIISPTSFPLAKGRALTTLGAVVTYVCVWWVIFFMALPWGAAPPETPEPGHATSAPERPRMLLKVAVTTVLAGVVTYGVSLVVDSGLIALRPPPGTFD